MAYDTSGRSRRNDEAPRSRGGSAATSRRSARPERAAARPTRTRAKAPPKPSKFEGVRKIDEAFTQRGLVEFLAEDANVEKAIVKDLLASLNNAAVASVLGTGSFRLPGLLRIVTKYRAATPARKGTSPQTGEEMTFEAKPARRVIKVFPSVDLKKMASKAYVSADVIASTKERARERLQRAKEAGRETRRRDEDVQRPARGRR